MKPNRFYSKRQERKVAELLDAKIVPNSGATHIQKGDVQGERILIEAKTLTRAQKSHSIKKEWLDQIRIEAFSRGKELAVLAFDFGDQKEQYFIVREDDFRQMYDAWIQFQNEVEGI